MKQHLILEKVFNSQEEIKNNTIKNNINISEYEKNYLLPKLRKELEYLNGQFIPRFKAINFEEKVIDVNYSKMTLLVFGSLTNQKCIDEIRYLNELYAKYHKKLEIIALYTDSYQELFRFKAYNSIKFEVIPDAQQVIEKVLKLQDMESKCVLIDNNGIVNRMLLNRDFLKLSGEFDRLEKAINN